MGNRVSKTGGARASSYSVSFTAKTPGDFEIADAAVRSYMDARFEDWSAVCASGGRCHVVAHRPRMTKAFAEFVASSLRDSGVRGAHVNEPFRGVRGKATRTVRSLPSRKSSRSKKPARTGPRGTRRGAAENAAVKTRGVFGQIRNGLRKRYGLILTESYIKYLARQYELDVDDWEVEAFAHAIARDVGLGDWPRYMTSKAETDRFYRALPERLQKIGQRMEGMRGSRSRPTKKPARTGPRGTRRGTAKKPTLPGRRGSLHRALGVPAGKKISIAKLRTAARGRGVLAKRARRALNLRGVRTKGMRRTS